MRRCDEQIGVLCIFEQYGCIVSTFTVVRDPGVSQCDQRALRAMISEFVFFIAIAAVCFSGILFTLWKLGTSPQSSPLCDPELPMPAADEDTWSIRSIAWLMIQIWFGSTYLSFAQAESFHPWIGPILMTVFACLTNSLLLTSVLLWFLPMLG